MLLMLWLSVGVVWCLSLSVQSEGINKLEFKSLGHGVNCAVCSRFNRRLVRYSWSSLHRSSSLWNRSLMVAGYKWPVTKFRYKGKNHSARSWPRKFFPWHGLYMRLCFAHLVWLTPRSERCDAQGVRATSRTSLVLWPLRKGKRTTPMCVCLLNTTSYLQRILFCS